MKTQELNSFAEERGLTLRYLKATYGDIIFREGRKLSIDAEAYDELMPKRSTNKRKKPAFSQKTILKRELNKLAKCDEFITASGQEISFLTNKQSREKDLRKVALLGFEIEELQEAIAERELLKNRSELKINQLIPPTSSKDSKRA